MVNFNNSFDFIIKEINTCNNFFISIVFKVIQSLNKYTIINAHNELISEELDRAGTITDQERKLEVFDTCWKLNKILLHFDKLEPYLDKAIREIEQQEKYERDKKNLDNWISKPAPIIGRDR